MEREDRVAFVLDPSMPSSELKFGQKPGPRTQPREGAARNEFLLPATLLAALEAPSDGSAGRLCYCCVSFRQACVTRAIGHCSTSVAKVTPVFPWGETWQTTEAYGYYPYGDGDSYVFDWDKTEERFSGKQR